MMNPNTRREAFMAKMAGMDVACPEPATREEMYLNAVAESGGNSGGYDMVIKSIATCPQNIQSTSTLTITKGSFADIIAKLNAMEMPSILLWGDYSDDWSGKWAIMADIVDVNTDENYAYISWYLFDNSQMKELYIKVDATGIVLIGKS